MSNRVNQSNSLTIKYLINLLNDQTNLQFNRHQYLIDSFPTLKIESNLTYDNLLVCLMIAYKNISYSIDEMDLHIRVNPEITKNEKNIIKEKIRCSTLESVKKIKYIETINTIINPTNESIVVLTYYFELNLLIYNSISQTIKCFYWDDLLDKDLPFIIIKESKELNSPNLYYEIVFSQNKFIFDYLHPIVQEMINVAFIIGLEQNKKLNYVETEKISDNDFKQSEILINSKQIITLKLIPKKILKIINEFQTMNFIPIQA